MPKRINEADQHCAEAQIPAIFSDMSVWRMATLRHCVAFEEVHLIGTSSERDVAVPRCKYQKWKRNSTSGVIERK